MKQTSLTLIAACAAALGTAHPAMAQEAETDGGIALELNTLADNGNGCLMTFVVESSLDASIDKAAYEVVLFDGEGLVERMTVLDFQDVPAGRTRVRQFNIGDTTCEDVSRVLVNDVSACEGEGVADGACIEQLAVSSQSDVEFSN